MVPTVRDCHCSHTAPYLQWHYHGFKLVNMVDVSVVLFIMFKGSHNVETVAMYLNVWMIPASIGWKCNVLFGSRYSAVIFVSEYLAKMCEGALLTSKRILWLPFLTDGLQEKQNISNYFCWHL